MMFKLLRVTALALAGGLLQLPVHAVEITATWTGGGGNCSWNNAANWDVGVVPRNVGPVIFDVLIPAGGAAVCFDIAGATTIKSLTLGNNRRLQPQAGTLTVTGAASIAGIVDAANGAAFAASGAGTGFVGDRARVYARGGANVLITAPAYSSKGLTFTDGNGFVVTTYTTDLFSASGAGTVLNLSSLQNIDAGFGAQSNDVNRHEIKATTGATLNLSGLQTVTAPVSFNDWVRFNVSGTSSLLLSKLGTVASAGRGRTVFDVSGGAVLSLPKLATLANADFNLGGGALVTAGPLSAVSDSRFTASGGSQFKGSSGAATYSSKGLTFTDGNGFVVTTYTTDLFNASGAGTVLNLSSLQNIDAGFGAQSNDINRHEVIASAGAKLTLSGVKTVTSPAAPNDWLRLTATGAGSTINLSGLNTTRSAGAGQLLFNATDGARIDTGSLLIRSPSTSITTAGKSTFHVGGDLLRGTGGKATIVLGSAGDRLEVERDFSLLTNISLNAAKGAIVAVGDDLSFTHTAESRMKLGDAIVQMNGTVVGADRQLLEVGGLDVYTFEEILKNQNFGFGRLVVGKAGALTKVSLVDSFDNGNRGSGDAPEALYLFGLGGSSAGLQILGGSTLFLNGLPAYASIGGTMTDLYTLFAGSATQVAFGGGFLVRPAPAALGSSIAVAVPEPGTWASLLVGLALLSMRIGKRGFRTSSTR